MLVHFPSGLYPFSFAMDCLGLGSHQAVFHSAAMYALEGALAMSVFAMIYGAIDFLQIDSRREVWKTAGIHALLNVCWFMMFGALLFYRLKNPGIGGVYVSITGFAVAGMIISNYLGGELVIKHKIGIDD